MAAATPTIPISPAPFTPSGLLSSCSSTKITLTSCTSTFYPLAMQTTVASHALAGSIEDAKRACALYLQLHPKTRLSVIKERMLCVRHEDVQKYVTGLLLAGLPNDRA